MRAHFPHPAMAVLGLTLLALPAVAFAQRGAGVPGVGPRGNPVSPLINMRRELNLTPRQLVQLDSIERTLIQRNRAVQERVRQRVDSLRPLRGRGATPEEREAQRSRLDSLRPLQQQVLRNDSTARAAAMAVLTDSQRVRVREWMAEQRGFMRGQAAARRSAAGPQRGMQGRMGFRPGQGRMGMAPGRMGMGPGRMGMGPGRMGMGPGRMGMGPGRMGMGQDEGPWGMRRGAPDPGARDDVSPPRPMTPMGPRRTRPPEASSLQTEPRSPAT